MRPASPLSCKATNFENLQPSSQRNMHSWTGSNHRRPQGHTLHLPSLPRFHPANFPSAHNSTQSTPDGASSTSSPQPPMSPRSHQRMYNDVQKQLYFNQRENLSARVTSSDQVAKPISPRLHPLGSPGPVTPLELGGDEGYLVGGARSVANSTTTSEELVETLIRQEARRHRTLSPKRGT
ncbi:uncharacterized protein RCC_02959 [Ramularia collo-cygni]|uniref:Uncharacterized protein n=1 Tax=Ramularia collo-cygni TaxID=112498 RepID=A0A2D3UXU1_9PEZI|nr:uncharacterized protein RCC_02959 [Ramularia collo-cygni]CZT17127.1 uncharacterized protein RCC_02959 [Ramularia collo-cygni]